MRPGRMGSRRWTACALPGATQKPRTRRTRSGRRTWQRSWTPPSRQSCRCGHGMRLALLHAPAASRRTSGACMHARTAVLCSCVVLASHRRPACEDGHTRQLHGGPRMHGVLARPRMDDRAHRLPAPQQEHTPSAEDAARRREVVARMDVIVRSGLDAHKHLFIAAYGSFLSGLYSPTGDLDLSIEGQLGRRSACAPAHCFSLALLGIVPTPAAVHPPTSTGMPGVSEGAARRRAWDCFLFMRSALQLAD
jgi:hypothetical protein